MQVAAESVLMNDRLELYLQRSTLAITSVESNQIHICLPDSIMFRVPFCLRKSCWLDIQLCFTQVAALRIYALAEEKLTKSTILVSTHIMQWPVYLMTLQDLQHVINTVRDS